MKMEETATSTGDSCAPISKVGPYLLGRVIGRGTSGKIYEAMQVEQARRVALKMLDRRILNDGPVSRQNALFAREAMILATLPRHPGILNVLDAGVADGLPYIVTEVVDGQPLSEAIRLRRPDLRGLVRIVRDVALAVHHAHENGILHRNLKPSNILVSGSDRACVTDFGQAKKLDAGHGGSTCLFRGGIVGTPAYMSPEQAASGKTVDRRTDVYSLGAILYEILTGQPPFVGGATVADLIRVIRGDITPPSTGEKALDKLCMSALGNVPDLRPPTAKAFADGLTAWLGEPLPARPPRRSWFRALIDLVCGN